MTLTDIQKAQVRLFLANKSMVEAVCAALLPDEPFAEGVDKTKDDAEYGRAVKVWIGTRDLIEQRFAQLKQLSSTNPQPAQENPSR